MWMFPNDMFIIWLQLFKSTCVQCSVHIKYCIILVTYCFQLEGGVFGATRIIDVHKCLMPLSPNQYDRPWPRRSSRMFTTFWNQPQLWNRAWKARMNRSVAFVTELVSFTICIYYIVVSPDCFTIVNTIERNIFTQVQQHSSLIQCLTLYNIILMIIDDN